MCGAGLGLAPTGLGLTPTSRRLLGELDPEGSGDAGSMDPYIMNGRVWRKFSEHERHSRTT